MRPFDDSPETVIAFGERHVREYLIIPLVMFGAGIIFALVGLAGLFRLIDADIETWFTLAGIMGFGAFLLSIAYFDQHKSLRKMKAESDLQANAYFQFLRKRWQYVGRTSIGRQYWDAFRGTIPLVVGLFGSLATMLLLGWGAGQLLPENFASGLRQATGIGIFIAMAMLVVLSYRSYELGLHRRGKAAGIQVVSSSFRAFEPVLKHVRARVGKGPVWLVIQMPGFLTLGENAPVLEVDWTNAAHAIVMDCVDVGTVDPHLTAPEFVALIQHPDIRHIPTPQGALDYLAKSVQPRDVVVILSVGDDVGMADTLLERLAAL